jgi:hypothetical protein
MAKATTVSGSALVVGAAADMQETEYSAPATEQVPVIAKQGC